LGENGCGRSDLGEKLLRMDGLGRKKVEDEAIGAKTG
jgi:hypothetical protein